MSDNTKAVFLSYASQDAEAAKRICEALRAAGVEVWFDAEGGLEHGDEWDVKIRRQIKDCVLFLPIISANTQAREEGYFRIEWELAAQRALGIASGVAFILPIVIDDTREPDALVPDRFRTVQWTRLPVRQAQGPEPAEGRGVYLPPEVLQRFLKLWSHRAGVVKHEAMEAGRPRPAEQRGGGTPSPLKPGWKAYAGLAVAIFALAGGATWWLWRGAAQSPAPSSIAKNPAQPAKAAVARDWPKNPELKRAIDLIEGLDSIPDDFSLAEEIAKSAVDRGPADVEAVAVMARVQSQYLRRGFDRTDERSALARRYAERALQLAPEEPEAMLALATYLFSRATDAPRAERLLRRAMELDPANPRHGRQLADLLLAEGRPVEGLAQSRETARRFPGDVLARYDLARQCKDQGLYEEFDRELDATLAIAPLPNAIVWKARLQFGLHNDFAGMKTWLDRVPERVRGTERAVFGYFLYAAFGGQAETGLEALRGFPQKWFSDFEYAGPTALLNASLLELQGKTELARQQYEAALTEIQKMRATDPGRTGLSNVEFWTLLGMGRKEEARESYRRVIEGARRPYAQSLFTGWWFTAIPASLLLGERTTALALLRESVATLPESRAAIRLRFQIDPRMQPWRDDPEIKALLAEPTASRPAADDKSAPADKSVAVLAFANLSDDKGNEYFSDGISEELLNVLAKIPGLKVTARTSSFHFKGKDTAIPEIARQLGVAYVIEGSVRKQGNQVRITAQLIKAADGFHVWSDTFTRDLKDIFAVQDEIAGLIARQLQLKLGESARAAKVVNPEAYRLLLEGRQFWNLRSEEGFTKAEAAFTKALALDPQFAEAHAGLGGVCVIRAIYRELDAVPLEANDLARAVSEGRRALEIDPSSADALAVLAYAQMMGNQLAESDRNFQQALTLNPNSALVHCWYALVLSVQGRLDDSLRHYQKAAEVDPLWFINLQMMGQALGFAQRYDQALGVLERANALRTEVFLPTMAEQTRALHELGRNEEAFALARQILHHPDQRPRWGSDARAIEVLLAGGRRQEAEDEAARLFTRYPPESYQRGFILAALGRFDEALPFLQRTQATIVRQLYWDTMWDPWREDPRFLQLMAKLGRAEEYKVARATLARMQAERLVKQ